ncbi:MAG: hypothetical protein R2712_05940 [Vicinamibacterales bacterium]
MVAGDELYQLYVAACARGGARPRACSEEARLACRRPVSAGLAWPVPSGTTAPPASTGKHGWRRAGVVVSVLPTEEGPFPIEVWQCEKPLA